MSHQFEAAGNIESWPPNVPGKPTQAAVFGCMHPARGKCCEILWTATFDDLDAALYWAAKKEMAATRRDKWIMASRVVWQHDLTAEQAVAACFKLMEPQLDRAAKGIEHAISSEDFDIGEGPMKPINPADAEKMYVEVVPADDDQADPIASFVAPGPGSPDWLSAWGVDGEEDGDNDVPVEWLPNDPSNN
jgi:hypothetical protein